MRCLLDSHTFLWFIAGDDRLSQRAREVLSDEEQPWVTNGTLPGTRMIAAIEGGGSSSRPRSSPRSRESFSSPPTPRLWAASPGA